MVSKQDNRRQHHLAVHTQFGRFGCLKTDEIRIKRVKNEAGGCFNKVHISKIAKRGAKMEGGRKKSAERRSG